MKKILMIEHYAGSPEMGMEFRPYYLSREWVRMGHRVDILAADFSHLRVKNPKIEKELQPEMIDGIRYHWVHTGTYEGNGVSRALTMAQFVGKLLLWGRRIAERLHPDVIIASSTYPLDTYVGQRIRKYSPGSVLIHEVHDMWPATLIEVGGMSRRNPFCVAMQIGENSAMKNSDRVVSLLPLTEPYMREHGLGEGRFFHVPNGVLPEEWEKTEPLPEEYERVFSDLRKRNRFIVGYFGGFAISNALDVLLNAAALTEERKGRASYVLVGDGEKKRELLEQAERMNLQEVYILPKLPKAAVPSLTAHFDCTYVGAKNSSLYRFGLGMNKIFDSMMAGKPILMAVSTPDDLILRNRCGVMVPSNEPQKIDDAVKKWENTDENELKRMGENGHRAALEKYTYPRLAEEFAKLF
ncbi:MAG: glycosyltransferase family 4 protein [Eubacterium sp.]|nr:glycosyltransferase family 4 protein [Eubacterium sp.]